MYDAKCTLASPTSDEGRKYLFDEKSIESSRVLDHELFLLRSNKNANRTTNFSKVR